MFRRPAFSRIRRFFVAWVALGTALLIFPDAGAARKPDGPDQVTVQHILIGFKHSVRNKKIARTKKQARALAERLYRRIQDGEDFDALVKEYTDDRYPGIFTLVNRGIEPMGRMSRDDMVPGFGDASFGLKVGEVVLVPWHYRSSPYGWHLIKRLE